MYCEKYFYFVITLLKFNIFEFFDRKTNDEFILVVGLIAWKLRKLKVCCLKSIVFKYFQNNQNI